ncbi:TPA: hypothetical protein RQK85_004327 [Vibrio vulnificus]|nr:hypothetical protein [Vibrio vulnificus]
MWDILLSALILLIGFVIGVWTGVFIEPSTATGEMTVSELLSLSFTILGGGAGFIATIFALFVYNKWRSQQRNETSYATKVSLMKRVCTIEVLAGNMLVARANPSISDVKGQAKDLVEVMSDIAVESDILATLCPEEDNLTKQARFLGEISAEILNLRLFPEGDHIDKIYIASTHEWSNEHVKGFFDAVEFESWGELGGRCYLLSSLKMKLEEVANEAKGNLRLHL